MNGTDKDAGRMAQQSTTTMAPPDPLLDYLGWFAKAAQSMLLQEADIRQYVANNGHLQDFVDDMAIWGRRFHSDDSSLAEGSKVLFGICDRFKLLKFVGSPQSAGPVRTRGAVRGGALRGGAVRGGAVRGAGVDPRLAQLRRELVRAFCAPG